MDNNTPNTENEKKKKKKRRNRKQRKKDKLREKENECLEEFKEKIKDVEITCERFKTDEMYRRYLRARQLNVEKAVEMFNNTIKWRKENDVDNAVQNFEKNKNYEALTKYWPGEVLGTDNEGVPVYYEAIARVDAKIVDVIPHDDLIAFHLWQMERGHNRLYELSKNKEIGYYSPQIIVQDLSGLGWKHYYTPGFNVIKRILDIDQAHYPECLKKFFIINTPTIFKIMWKVVKPMIDAHTLEKILIMGSDYQDTVFKSIPKQNVPIEFGGKLKGEIPKAGKFVDVKDDGTTSNPVTIAIARSEKIEVPVDILTEGSNLAWEFKTQAHDVGFSVFYDNNGTREEVLKYERYDCSKEQIDGSLERLKNGKYFLVFDNTFSYLRSKNLTYQIFISAPVEKSLNELNPQIEEKDIEENDEDDEEGDDNDDDSSK